MAISQQNFIRSTYTQLTAHNLNYSNLYSYDMSKVPPDDTINFISNYYYYE